MAESTDERLRFLRRLRAVREYTAEPVDQAAIEDILEVARWSGTGGNRQPIEVIVVRDPEVKRQFGEWGARPAATAAVVMLLVTANPQALFDEGRVAERVALAAAGHTSTLAAMVDLPLPLESHPLQALVSELLEPVHPTVVMSNAVHVYVSQAHKGELVLGAGIDPYTSYAQRGSFHVIERQMAATLELFPIFAHAHVLRTWAGTVDVCPDASPISGLTPVERLYLNCGWGTGGFKATPAAGETFAYTIAHDAPHPLAAPYTLERFHSGALIDEHGAAAVAH